MSDFVEIQATLADDLEDELAESMSSWSILGVEVVPECVGRIRVGVWFRAGDDRLAEQIQTVLNGFGSDAIRIREHTADDWAAEWRKGLSAFGVGRTWWIDPHPEQATAPPDDRFRLAVEPRAAFGSGTHESTQLVLMELEEQDCRTLRVLDIGTGSGVLAIAADRLGASSVVALDTDPIAAWEARTTIERQPWCCRSLVVAGGVDCLGEAGFDLVFCNMILAEFRPLLRDIHRFLSSAGTVIFSGILDSERGEVDGLLEGNGMTAVGGRGLNGWISVRAVRSESPA